MNVICLEEPAFIELVDRMYAYLKEKDGDTQDKWVDGEEAMRLLRVKSRSTLLSLRQDGKIRFTQPQKKIILYDRHSIEDYLDKHAKDTF